MVVIDTSAWVEYLLGTPLGREMVDHFTDSAQCVVPTIVQLELMKWLSREISEDVAERVIAYTQTCDLVPLDTRIALRAADLCREHKLATADAVIYATALERNVQLLTCDAHFKGLDGVRYHRKARSR